MFDGFQLSMIDTGEATIRVRHGGSGPPLLLLHGHPQTHVMWHKVAPRLARDFTVVAADLRGYGDSSKPPTTPDHEPYSKRAMARDQVAVMRQLGFETFFVAGHDRGGRCAYRMALDHPERVLKAGGARHRARPARPSAAPTWRSALGYWHWFFLAQPDRPAGADDRRRPATSTSRDRARTEPPGFAPEALADYLRCYRNPATIHAICEDYRAGATIDFAHRRGRPRPAADRLPAAGALGQPRLAATNGTTSWPSGATGPTMSAAAPSTAATSLPRKRPRTPVPHCRRSSQSDPDASPRALNPCDFRHMRRRQRLLWSCPCMEVRMSTLARSCGFGRIRCCFDSRRECPGGGSYALRRSRPGGHRQAEAVDRAHGHAQHCPQRRGGARSRLGAPRLPRGPVRARRSELSRADRHARPQSDGGTTGEPLAIRSR